ncbi:MAG: hypothetical protein EYC70_09310 [Planctomycetota bacterium]|nr:MAG: hypothetical protein EYC70_09310 [Planctomycetota bacterium]
MNLRILSLLASLLLCGAAAYAGSLDRNPSTEAPALASPPYNFVASGVVSPVGLVSRPVNVSQVLHIAAGTYEVKFSSPRPHTDYVVQATCGVGFASVSGKTTNGFTVTTRFDAQTSNGGINGLADSYFDFLVLSN